MTALSGVVSYDDEYNLSALCARVAAAQDQYGPHDRSLAARGGAAFGRSLYRLLPEDAFDAQPLRSADGRHLFVADLRLDNRDELASALGFGAEARRLADSDILFAAFRKWREGVLDRAVGDFAFAAWDDVERTLFLARDPLGQRPLQYCRHEGVFAFASMPSGLHALGVERAPDLRRIAEFLADTIPVNGHMGFTGIDELPAGHWLRLTRHGIEQRRYWDPAPRELRLPSQDDYVEAFREQLDRAVQCRLRGAEGRVGSHLSSGFDSSSVATTAARLLRPQNGTVYAFTAAPREGFCGPVPRGRIGDESGIAAETAALHDNLEHVVVRPDGTTPFELLDALHAAAQHPGGHICNHVWWDAIHRAAHDRGLTVLLTGEMGNLTISAGGLFQLADLIREGRWLSWLREAPQVRAKTAVNWKGILGNSFGPWFPRPLWRLLTRKLLQMSPRLNQPFLLNEPFLGEMMALHALEGRDPRPPRNSLKLRLELLKRQDFGNFRKAFLVMWGIDERDPTADPRLIEFCLSLPPEQLLKDGLRRPLARAALADRLPESVLEPKLRGYQMADWYEQIRPADARAAAERLATNPAAASLVNFEGVRDMLDSWPKDGLHELRFDSEYRGTLLRALAAAHFVAFASSDARASSPDRPSPIAAPRSAACG